MNKLLRIYLTVAWAFFIFKLLTLPLPSMPDAGPQISFTDKLVHLLIFGLLSYFLARTLEHYLIGHHRTVIVLSLLLPAFYGLLLEYLQGFIPGRSTSLLDTSAGLAGGLFGVWAYHLAVARGKPKLLLHVCCIACGAYVADMLKKNYRPILFFYNPNIYPEAEYFRRLRETKRVAKILGLPVLTGAYDHPVWRELVRGHEDDPERGERCLICYRERLEAAARLANEQRFSWFASTLTVSPHKLAEAISQIGRELAAKYSLEFLDQDFKKQDGFKKSLELSKRLDLYRQSYCGCEFSQKQKIVMGSTKVV